MQSILAGSPKLWRLLHWSKQQRNYSDDGNNVWRRDRYRITGEESIGSSCSADWGWWEQSWSGHRFFCRMIEEWCHFPKLLFSKIIIMVKGKCGVEGFILLYMLRFGSGRVYKPRNSTQRFKSDLKVVSMQVITGAAKVTVLSPSRRQSRTWKLCRENPHLGVGRRTRRDKVYWEKA